MPKEKKPYEGVAILTVNGYMQKYGVEGIGKGADRTMIRSQLLDAFRKEIFDTAMMMVDPHIFMEGREVTDKEREKLDNIVKNANKKWKSLCKEFAKYRETCNLIDEEDLMKYMNDRNAALQANEGTEYYTDEEFEEMTGDTDGVEDGELSEQQATDE